MTDGNESAFARPHSVDETGGDMREHHFSQQGLTKREYFAAMAMSSGKSAEEAIVESDNLIKLLNDTKGKANV